MPKNAEKSGEVSGKISEVILQEVNLKTYRLYHRIQKVFREAEAELAQEACDQVGWLIGDVWVRELTPVVSDPNSDSGHRGGGWKNITPRKVS